MCCCGEGIPDQAYPFSPLLAHFASSPSQESQSVRPAPVDALHLSKAIALLVFLPTLRSPKTKKAPADSLREQEMVRLRL